MKLWQFIVILTLFMFVVAGCAINPVTGKKELMIFSDQQEISFGSEADPDVRWQFGGSYEDS